MQINLTLQRAESSEPLAFNFTRMINAGYVGRDQEVVRKYIAELAAKGIPGPKSTPALFPVNTRALVIDKDIEVYGDKTAGEVEYVLLIQDAQTIYVGMGSDHTDRLLEETDIPRSKQICPNVMCPSVWLLSDVEPHWDELTFDSQVVNAGETVPNQDGRLATILNPASLMDFVRSKVGRELDGTLIFSGTVGTISGQYIYGERFIAGLHDPILKRSLSVNYGVQTLDYLDVE
ncbi:MAG: DUF2848 family protein [Thermodesulfobacteriota bacterium]